MAGVSRPLLPACSQKSLLRYVGKPTLGQDMFDKDDLAEAERASRDLDKALRNCRERLAETQAKLREANMEFSERRAPLAAANDEDPGPSASQSS